MKERNAMQEVTWKLYSPLTAEFFPQEVYDDPDLMDREGPMELDGKSLAEYADEIREAVEKDSAITGDFAQYMYGRTCSVPDGKVLSLVPSVEMVEDTLTGCATVKLREPLTSEECAALKIYLIAQYADGWGEGFEQREIETVDGVLFVHFWNSEEFHIRIDRNLGSMQQETPAAAPTRAEKGKRRRSEPER